jgi:hypothetical protein
MRGIRLGLLDNTLKQWSYLAKMMILSLRFGCYPVDLVDDTEHRDGYLLAFENIC